MHAHRAGLVILCALVSGCATNMPVDSSCKSFRPISNSTKDTEQTRREVIAHNRVYRKLCS